ncbi:bifunctional 3'-5' exonuclease/ATP-dependent helicase WRN isoform X2 [Hirundo rustica]|uniref:bifunctional 3'-5' exonuclease/ATP-dependent helicase WRN isoform X2 n=1 Tax=Hirundo rustica TaxID=43150 RepID=UPI001A941AB2|nr:bifunctional 3'-5' exonuclease/ATP-dependent helicase WRN isoform X2 [Hirundo rustica]
MDVVTAGLQDKYPQWMLTGSQEEASLGHKKKPGAQRSVLEHGLPFLEFCGSVVYSYEASDCSLLSEDIRQSLPDGAAVGFDIEWPPSYMKGKVAKTAVIQMCVAEDKCYLFHISSMAGFPKGLKRLLEDETIKKVGVGIEGDQWKLMSDFEIKLKSFVELTDVANEKLKCKETWSLNGLVKHLFGRQLLKDQSIRCSNWEKFPLNEEQKLYAATDAYAGFIIYEKLKNMSKSDWKLLSVRKDATSEGVKERLASLAEEITDLASRIPHTSGQLENFQRAAGILAEISENISALKTTLLGSGSPSGLERSCGANTTHFEAKSANVKAQKAECAEQPEGDLNICSDATLAALWEEEMSGEEAHRGNTALENGAPAARFADKEDRDDFMSLDITEQELQVLERQAAKELVNEVAPEEACSTDNEQNVSCVIESDEELEMEMLKSLKDVDDCEGALPEGESSKARKTPNTEVDVAPDGDEDEGIEEEEEEYFDPLLPEPGEGHIMCLKTYFGHSSFKPVQWKVINSLLEDRRDNLVVMATGYGKSLCYQFPPVYTGHTGVVICPLISLMEDQVLQLTMTGIPACFLGSAQSKQVKDSVRGGQYRVIYMTPEFCSGNLNLLQDLDQTVGITLIAVDEAHCISEWGHDFRNSFRSLGLLKKTLPSIPIIALTATASPSIREDIVKCLNLRNPQVTCTSFDRPNLYLEVGQQSGDICRDLKQFLTRKGSSSVYEFEGPTIIYCPTRKTTEQVVCALNKLNVACGTYHAGMGNKQRRDTHHRFMRDEIQCVVATVAFGMGINKADIRLVIHYGAPKEMESYYQEMGRAGRDGLPAACHVLWTAADLACNRRLLREICNEKFRLYKLKMLAKMEKYLVSNSCRRKIILSHFEDRQLRKVSSGITGTEECCDNCRSSSSHLAVPSDFDGGLQDFGKQAHQLLSAVSALDEKFGTRMPILLLRGSCSQRLPDRYQRHPLFGCGKEWPENRWKLLCQQLILEGFLKEVSARHSKFATICVLTQKGRNWLSEAGSNSNPSLLLQSSEDLNLHRPSTSSRRSPVLSRQRSPGTKGTAQSPGKQMSLYEMFCYGKDKTPPRSTNMPNSVSGHSPLKSPLKPQNPGVSSREKELETALYGKLLTARQKVANEKEIPPAVLATNKILVEMARIRPTSIENLKKIDGVSEAKSTMLMPLLAEIKDFCQVNGLQTDTFPTSESKVQKEASPWKCARALSPSEEVTYILFQEKNYSLGAISECRSLPLAVVGTHLSQALRVGYAVSLERAGLTPAVQQVIRDVIRNPPINSDTTKIQEIRKLTPANIELYLIKMMIALLEKEERNKSQGGLGIKRRLVWPEGQQGKRGADQACREGALWSKTQGNGINPASKEGAEKTHLHMVPLASAAGSVDASQAGSSRAAGPSKPITPASSNQPALDPEEEELFADSQPKNSHPPAKRRVPEWFGTSAARAEPATQTKKCKTETRKGIFS